MIGIPRRRLFLAISLLAAAAFASPAEKLRNHFDSDTLLTEPAFFDFLELGVPGEARWRVTAAGFSSPSTSNAAGFSAPSTPNYVLQVLEARPADSIAAAIRRNAVFENGTWSVAIRKGQGKGGLVFRLSSEKRFLALLIDLRTGEADLRVYRDGRPAELARGKAKLANDWGVLKITASGPKISAEWDGEFLLEATDARPAPGSAGMATAGPGSVPFDEFILDPAGEPAGGKR